MDPIDILNVNSYEDFIFKFDKFLDSFENDLQMSEFDEIHHLLNERKHLEEQFAVAYNREVVNLIKNSELEFEGIEIPTLELMKISLADTRVEFAQRKEEFQETYSKYLKLIEETKNYSNEIDLLKKKINESQKQLDDLNSSKMLRISKFCFKTHKNNISACLYFCFIIFLKISKFVFFFLVTFSDNGQVDQVHINNEDINNKEDFWDFLNKVVLLDNQAN